VGRFIVLVVSIVVGPARALGRPHRGRSGATMLLGATLALTMVAGAGATVVRDAPRCAPQGVVVYDGDSLTAHLPVSPQVLVAFDDTRAALGPSLVYQIVAVRGQTAVQMVSRAPTIVDPFYRPQTSVDLLVAWAGTNDLDYHSPTGGPVAAARDAFHALRTYGVARRRVGWFVVVLTVLPRRDHDVPYDFAQARTLLNRDLRDGWPAFANALVDVAGDPRLGSDGAPLRARYYLPDHVHLTSVGQRIVADLELPVLERRAACRTPGPLPSLDHLAPVAPRPAAAGPP